MLVLQTITLLAGNPFVARLNEGGPLFMYTTLFILIIITALLIRGFLKPTTRDKTITLVSSLSLFVLVWGFLGQMIGLIGAFDAIQAVGDISPAVLAGGLKIAILSPLFGMIVFLIARIGIIILKLLKK
ncbi:MotA/TolQ/ExbB proton channel family protein [Lutibacter sp. A64]|uniref:MotA/TolQ/ExbB proton channel family protein n=1 Tax=Lutibacter sp. A64 TaxID=2918526 RepID=UPI001F0511B9|nr:MotA/TolQ/ExbB proton channel family protein [Lutibacter sp. A64]UMB53732.1 MotA/TolQ/ExbB proton channel family protein [Lutibacter sp. A64]